MKSLVLFLIITLWSPEVQSQQGSSVTLLGHLDKRHGQLGDYFYSDCWGYTAPDGREYALLVAVDGTAIIDITDPANPHEVDFVPAPLHSNRDIKTYSHYAYVVSERDIGMQIIDLSFLPDSVHLVKNWTDGGFTRAHSIFQDGPYLYLVGGNAAQNGGIAIVSLADPVNPIKVGEWNEHQVHDLYVRNDTIYAASMGNGFDIIDVQDKSNPQRITGFRYENSGTHNIWLTGDGKYLLTTDEIDHPLKNVKIWDIQDLDNIKKIAEYTERSDAVVHNVYVRGNYAHLAYYAEGYVVIDITDPTNPIKVGGYSTYPSNEPIWAGVWGLYPFFSSGNIIASDRQTGLYIFSFDSTVVSDFKADKITDYRLYQNYPNPFNFTTTISYDLPQASQVNLSVYNLLGQVVENLVNEFQTPGVYSVTFQNENLPSGIYFCKFNAGNQVLVRRMIFISAH